jgi:hypothetical protein
MQAQTLTPFQIFGNQVRYVVPMFQRPYVWTKVDQWDPLWNDVRTVTERLLDAVESTAAQQSAQSPPHFLGAIVLDQQLTPAAYIPVRYIIDGQQRLTTLQLLLDAGQIVMAEHGAPSDASALETLVLNNAAIAQGPDDVFKVWPTNADRAAFRAAMDNISSVPPDLVPSRIAQGHAFFVSEITEWADVAGDPDKVKLRLHALAVALMQYLKLVVIDLEPGDNAQVIFETLNHRGTPLLAADLVKNFLFQMAEAEESELETLYEEHWAPFDEDTWRRKVAQGRFYRPRIDVFLNYWLVMRTGREVIADRVFADFRDAARLPGETAEGLMADLSRYAAIYDKLEHLDAQTPEGIFAYRVLTVMDQFAWGPVLLWLFAQPDEEPFAAQRRLALRAIESWLVRRMLCRLTGKRINQMVLEVLACLREGDGTDTGRVVVNYLAEKTTDSDRWPTDGEVVESLRQEPLYRSITRGRLRMLLEALEEKLRGPLAESDHCPKGLTVEHVLPQGWREHWLLPPDGEAELLAVKRDRNLHALGNLTLVNNKLNPTLSNRPWTDTAANERGLGQKGKRSVIGDHSVLHLNKKILDDAGDVWDEAVIATRSESLAGLVIAIWPPADAFAD